MLASFWGDKNGIGFSTLDEIKFLNYVGYLWQRNGKRVKIFIPQRTLCTDGRHRCDKPVNVLRRSFHISLKKITYFVARRRG